jgi:alkane 1-monooxygenase
VTGYTGISADGEAVYYRDGKRWFWLLSVIYPLQPLVGIALHAASGNELWLWLPIATTFIGGPLLDALFGEDENNPPAEVVMQLEQDRYYRVLTYIAVPMHLIGFLAAAYWLATEPLSATGYLGLALVAGMTSGLAINTGHELGHKRSRLERGLSKLALAIPAYGHFTIDHNRGHHIEVATAEDCASSRMGESIYRFALREIPGALRRAWHIEAERLVQRGKPVWHTDNRILRSWALTAVLQGGLILVFGWSLLPFLLIHNAAAYWQLTSANYIEHYGLLRLRDADGKLERCQPHHSWNSNHIVSNLSLFHLERHSDHHTHPLRRYQSLRHFDDLPSLPTGYFGAYLLAYLPWLWYRVMDPKLLALPHVQGDLTRLNLDPRKRAQLLARYGADPLAGKSA